MINTSIESGHVPGTMKLAKVIPIYKSKDKQMLNNYRPISLLPIFSKIIEKVIYQRLGIRKELKMKLVKALIWPVITYGAEGWTLKKDDERRLEAAEMWCYRRMLRISWTEKRTNKSILNELQTRRELLAQIIKRKMAFFGHACRNNKCNLVKTCILGMMSGKRRRGRPRMQYIDNIKKWTRASLEENVRLSEDRSAWRERSCAAGAANVRTDDAD